MKQRKPLNIGDQVKYFGYDDALILNDTEYSIVKEVRGNIVVCEDGIGNRFQIDRRQVYAVKRKKKAVKVISDERFYCGQYTDYIYDSLSAAMREAEISGNEILELGIVARHKVKK
jgi:hypothetical protein